MTTPRPDDSESEQTTEVPPVSPAYSTPPPDGLPDAETEQRD